MSLLGLAGCTAPKGYNVTGHVPKEIGDGTAYLITSSNNQNDTIAEARVVNGTFKFQGTCQEITPVLLSLSSGTVGALPVFLENANYEIEIYPGNIELSTVKGGGETQCLSIEYSKIGLEIQDRFKKMQEEMMRAFQQGDTAVRNEVAAKTRLLIQESEKKQAQFMIEHGNSFLALYDLSQKALGMTADDVKARFDLCDDELKATKPGKYIQELLPKLGKIAIGATVPNFTSRTPDGKEVSLYDIDCKVKLIDFWASNCGICREENQLIKPLYEQYHAKGFDAISYSIDRKREAWVNAVEKDALPWVQVSDLDADKAKVISEMYGVYLLPTTLLVDENNRVIARNVKSSELKELLAKLLPEK